MSHNQKWMEKYKLLKEYQKEYGNIDVPQSYEKDGMKLGQWLATQRKAYKGKGTNRITQDQIKLLEELGIHWQVHNKTWEDYYELLKEYKEEHGNIDVPQAYEKNGIKLGIWLHNQKQAYNGNGRSSITQDQIKLLEELGIHWQVHNKTWEDYYELLKEYKEEHGNIDVPNFYEKNGMKLGKWLSTQRQAYKGNRRSRITQNQIKLLEELGIRWNPYDQKWNDYYELLKEYQEEHGNIDVPNFYEKNGMKLGKWLSTQRQAYKGNRRSRITQNQIKLLEELGIRWNPYDQKWNDYYELLKEYQEEHGNIDVPTYYQVNQINLGVWLHHQRQAYKGQKSCVITKNQIRLLNELNIDWNLRDTKFLQKTINEQTQEKYQQVLLERVNHIIEDLVYEGINDIDATNQKEIEKVMIKRIWR